MGKILRNMGNIIYSFRLCSVVYNPSNCSKASCKLRHKFFPFGFKFNSLTHQNLAIIQQYNPPEVGEFTGVVGAHLDG